ncbi:uncharacterized, partial [Tachysurus ichikawai]
QSARFLTGDRFDADEGPLCLPQSLLKCREGVAKPSKGNIRSGTLPVDGVSKDRVV